MNAYKKSNKTPKEKLANKVRRLASEAIDIYCHGIDCTGEKGLIYTPNKDTISTLFAYPHKPSSTADAYTIKCYNEDIRALSKLQQDNSFSTKKILKHIKKVEKQYYCNSQFGKVFWMGMDIDNDTDDPDTVLPWLEFFLNYFPNVWSDRGSSGNSLHPIIRTNMTPLLNYYISLNQSKLSYPAVANKVVYAIAHIIKLYGHLILTPDHKLITNKRGKLVPAYDVELCSIKGSYSDWKHYYDNDDNLRLTNITKFGTLFKFPNIFTDADYTKFKNAPIYSIVDIINFCIYLSSSLALSHTLSPEQATKLSKDVELLEAVLSANGLSLPSIPVPVLVEPVAVMPVNTSVSTSFEREKEKERRKNKSIRPYLGLESVSSDDIGCYGPTIPKYTDEFLQRADKIAKCLKEHGVRMNAISRDLILQIFGKEEAFRIYPQIQTEAVSKKGKDLMIRIEEQLFDELESMGYSSVGRIVEKNHTYDKWKTVTDRRAKRYIPGLLKKHCLMERTANKELKTQLGIESRGYPKVIIKKTETDGTINLD